jgi:hypothetical protein
MTVMLLAGPPTVGHNTIALLGDLRPRMGVVDVDEVRAMERSPAAEPWEGVDGEERYRRSIRRACLIARDFDRQGYDVAFSTWRRPRRWSSVAAGCPMSLGSSWSCRWPIPRYRSRETSPTTTPPDAHDLAAWHGRIRMLQAQRAAASERYDVVIDNGRPRAKDTARR